MVVLPKAPEAVWFRSPVGVRPAPGRATIRAPILGGKSRAGLPLRAGL
jgi:hypothetical protein